MFTDLTRARMEVTASSAGGSPFLLAFGVSLGLVGLAAFWLPAKTAALVLLFQGNVALPVAFWLERRWAWGTMAKDNPLRALSVQLAMSQLAALPMVIIAYDLAPATTGAAIASVAAGHLVPYAWLHRTAIYLWLAPCVSVGALGVVVVKKGDALPWTLLFMSAAYLVAAALLYRHARNLHGEETTWHTESTMPVPLRTARP